MPFTAPIDLSIVNVNDVSGKPQYLWQIIDKNGE